MMQDEHLIKKIQKIIEMHLANPELKGSLIAKELEINRMKIHRVLKRAFDQNARDFITKKRIAHAQNELLNTSKFVYQIALEVGYTDPRHFAKVFKKMVGISPTGFKKSKK